MSAMGVDIFDLHGQPPVIVDCLLSKAPTIAVSAHAILAAAQGMPHAVFRRILKRSTSVDVSALAFIAVTRSICAAVEKI